MDNPQDALSTLLSDPAALSAAMELAKNFLSSSPAQPAPEKAADTPPPTGEAGPAPLSGLGGMLAGAGQEDDKAKLLLALKPFLSPKRSEKVGTVLTLMRAMQMMGAASIFDFGKRL